MDKKRFSGSYGNLVFAAAFLGLEHPSITIHRAAHIEYQSECAKLLSGNPNEVPESLGSGWMADTLAYAEEHVFDKDDEPPDYGRRLEDMGATLMVM